MNGIVVVCSEEVQLVVVLPLFVSVVIPLLFGAMHVSTPALPTSLSRSIFGFGRTGGCGRLV